jgi:DNA-binding response OmpR family regulator
MRIGLLEDEKHLAEYVQEILETAGYSVVVFSTGADMIKALARDTFDVYVLDWYVPLVSGLEVLRHIRQSRGNKEPVLFLTSKSEEHDIVAALNAGADDYCIKPIRPQEFLARLQALLRRSYGTPSREVKCPTILNYTFNKLEHSVLFQQKQISLTEKEFKLALFLFENHDRALSRERLIQEIWNTSGAGESLSRSLDVHVSWLRKKLALSTMENGVQLKPIYGFGYRLMAA